MVYKNYWLIHLHCNAFVLSRCVYLISFINQRLKCREESMISANCHQDVFQRINLMSNYPTEELSQTFNERDVALRRQKMLLYVLFKHWCVLESIRVYDKAVT